MWLYDVCSSQHDRHTKLADPPGFIMAAKLPTSLQLVLFLFLLTAFVYVVLFDKLDLIGKATFCETCMALPLPAPLHDLNRPTLDSSTGSIASGEHPSSNDSRIHCVSRKVFVKGLPVTALASFPGSGNTWARYLIEKSTGKCANVRSISVFMKT